MHRATPALLAAAISTLSVAHAQPAPPPAVHRNQVVSFACLVVDSSGHLVPDLHPSNFTVYDNNTVQPIYAVRILHGDQPPLPILRYTTAHPIHDGRTAGPPRITWYVVEFYPPQPATPAQPETPGYHQVGIRIDRPNLTIYAPQGYTLH